MSKSVPDTVAEAMIMELATQEVDVVFLNPGTDTAPLQEAMARLHAKGARIPRVVLCPHEAVALAAAHAYFAVTGRPQVVMVHVDVGTQNLGSMLHNAHRGEAGVVVIAGRTPVTAQGELPGGRDHVVHWQQDVTDQVGIVRSYVKHTADIECPETVHRQLSRAFHVANACPNGPVYLTVARELLMAPMPSGAHETAVPRSAMPAPTAPSPEALEVAVNILVDSNRPVLTTTRVGRNPQAVEEMVRLAELLGAPVIDRRERVNFPSTHPAYLRDDEVSKALEDADVVLAIDSVVPWVPLVSKPSENAAVILVDRDPVKMSMPGWSFPADVVLEADPALCIRVLCDALAERESTQPATLWEERRRRLRSRPDAVAVGAAGGVSELPVPPAEAIRALDGLLMPEDIVIEEATTNSDVLRSIIRRSLPGTHFHPGGSGLGWGLGGALGAKLAAPDQRVVAVVGDGSFIFSSPTAALWAARAATAPFLTVVLQNGGYAASCRPVFDLFPEGASMRAHNVVGTRLDDPPDYALIAQACGAFGECLTDPADLIPKFKRALAAVDGGACAVVVVPVSSPWLTEPGEKPQP